MKLPLLVLCLVMAACVNAPTTVTDSDVSLIQRAYEFEKASRPIKITPETVVLDVRAFFDYQLLRIPGSIFVDANEFILRRKHGEDLQAQATKFARRFALMGINPFSHVVIVGYGEKGHGEEGTIALTLLALGVERVQLGTFKNFKFLASNKHTPSPANQRYWEPRIVSCVVCAAHTNNEAFIIDVGNRNSSGAPSAKSLGTLAKDWREFVNVDDFSPNVRIKDQLKANKLSEGSLIRVSGPQAPLVVFSLLQLGYESPCMMDN